MPTPADLRRLPALADLSDSQLQWLLDRSVEQTYAPGEYLSRAGDDSRFMIFVLEGGIEARSESGDSPSYSMPAGAISGALPFSRMKQFPLSTRATRPTRVLLFDKAHFPALYQEIPDLIPRLVAILTDRVRESARATTQFEKLAAIGKLSAGLAHELNNPAAAARQGATAATQLFSCYRDTMDQLAALCPPSHVYETLRQLESAAAAAVQSPLPIDSLTRSDLEESLASWLSTLNCPEPWHMAPALVSANFSPEQLSPLFHSWSPQWTRLALARIAAAIEIEQVLSQVRDSTSRISDLVHAMKDYSFMDRAAEAEIDINRSLETTLALFAFRFKNGIDVTRQFSSSLPKVCGHGGQLSQIWTNLIDNALHAMATHSRPPHLTITTRSVLNHILIEIADNGPGIPAEVLPQIFTPFFTTKPQGIGTGLGLDTVYRIIQQHHGDIQVSSSSAGATFTITLPAAS